MNIIKNKFLETCSTIRIGDIAPYFGVAHTEAEVVEAIAFASATSLRIYSLGNGSNILFGVLPSDAFILKQTTRQIHIEGNKLYAQAGAYLPKLAQTAYAAHLSGLEWAINVPGTLGGAIVMNAGAFSQEIVDQIVSVDVLTYRGERRTLYPSDIKATHRWTSIDPARYIVLGACLQLVDGDASCIASCMQSYRKYRRQTQPRGLTLGSTFKRHYEAHSQKWTSAGYYIDQCQLKGCSIGGAQISHVHANFIMNVNQASYKDVLALMSQAKHLVNQRFGIKLEPEIKLWVDNKDLEEYQLKENRHAENMG